MSLTALLNATGTVSRNTPGAADAYGQPAESWANVATGVACRIAANGGKEVFMKQQAVIAEYDIYLPAATDITEEDRFVSGGVTYEILMVESVQAMSAAHHKKCLGRAVR